MPGIGGGDSMGAPLDQVAPLIIPSFPLFVMSIKALPEPSLKL